MGKSQNAKKAAKNAGAKARRAVENAAKKASASMAKWARNKGRVTGNPNLMHPKAKAKGAGKRARKSNGVSKMAAPVSMGYSLHNKLGGPQVSTTGMCENAVTAMTTATAGSFQVLYTWPINPGNSAIFPRAQAQASIFEKWRLKHFEVEYLPLVSSTSAGFFGMYIDPDATDSGDTNITSMMENKFNEGGSLWVPQTLTFSGPDLGRWYYTSAQTSTSSSGGTANALDRQQFPGVLRVVADKCAANQALGLLKIRYCFEFCDPKPPGALMLFAQNTGYTYNTGTVVAWTAGQTYYFPMSLPTLHQHGFNVAEGPTEFGTNFAGGDQGDIDANGVIPYSAITINDGSVLAMTGIVVLPTLVVSGPNVGSSGVVNWCVFSTVGDVVTEIFNGPTGAPGSLTVPSASSLTFNFNTRNLGEYYHVGIKAAVAGTGSSGGTLTSPSFAGSIQFARWSVAGPYGSTASTGPSSGFGGVLPGDRAALDAWLDSQTGSFAITVSPAPALTPADRRQAILDKLVSKFAHLLEDGDSVSVVTEDDDFKTEIEQQQAQRVSLTNSLKNAVPPPRK